MDNSQHSFVNSMSAGQFQDSLHHHLHQSPFLSLYNVSGFQNNFYQQPNVQALQHMMMNNIRCNENLQQLMPRPVLGSNLIDSMDQVAHQLNQFGQMSHPVSSPAAMNSLLTSQKSESGLGTSTLNAENENFKIPFTSTPIKPDLKMKVLFNLQRIALKGCESAARIFQFHSKRPYFKKIDLLCDRLKQDLGTTDKAVVNINSHGVAWAIKDFIFVFNRIMNGWAILRDYFYSTSEGMRCVNEAVDSNLAEDFMKWQVATEKLANSLVNSFENLHNLNQRNSNRKTAKNSGSSNGSTNNSTADLQINFQHIFDPLIAEDSEQSQLGGGYLKSAVYKPLLSEGSLAPNTPSSINDFDSFKLLFNDAHQESFYTDRSGSARSTPLYKRCSNESSEEASKKSINRLKVNLVEKFDAVNLNDNSKEGALFEYLFSCPETP